ncbi:MAG: hypothetical protein H6738_16490 [Alphaproteobacteria bacterium]|nr:hypothetical protein [Alphaproteobacteria bacterium]MCB9698380.1 hypothetical protein [Alphaproteobacteria bacterium]
MVSPLHVLTWWPRPRPDADDVVRVERTPAGPGMVTLRWETGSAVPSLLTQDDGQPLFRDPEPRQQHQVTLSATPGSHRRVYAHARDTARPVELDF